MCGSGLQPLRPQGTEPTVQVTEGQIPINLDQLPVTHCAPAWANTYGTPTFYMCWLDPTDLAVRARCDARPESIWATGGCPVDAGLDIGYGWSSLSKNVQCPLLLGI